MATSHRVRVVVNSLEDFLHQLIKAITLDIVANLKMAAIEGGTPVDTGWARANWVPKIGGPFEGTAGTREAAESGNVNEGLSEGGVATVAAKYKTTKGPVHITNNVPYIVNLNEGTSKQAPAGFVQRAIIKAITVDLLRKLGGNPTPRGRQPRDPVTGKFLPRRG